MPPEETAPPPQRGGGVDFYVDSKARASSNLAELDQPVTAKGAADEASMSKMKGDLAASQAYDARLGTTMEGANAPITVTADGTVAERTFSDTNQTARPTALADPSKQTLISESVAPGDPNSNMANAHAEIGVIQQAADAGFTKGQEMTIVVRGKDVCSFCQSDLGDMANLSGLNRLTVVETTTGKVYTWARNSDGGQWTAPYQGPLPLGTGSQLYPMPTKP